MVFLGLNMGGWELYVYGCANGVLYGWINGRKYISYAHTYTFIQTIPHVTSPHTNCACWVCDVISRRGSFTRLAGRVKGVIHYRLGELWS